MLQSHEPQAPRDAICWTQLGGRAPPARAQDGAGGKRCTSSRGVSPRPVFKWVGPTVGVGASCKHTQQWVTQSWPTLSPRAPPAVATGGGWTILCTHQVHPALVQKPTVLQSQQPQVPRDSIWRQLGDQ
ncbi:uncharacterized protein LOC144150115 isoform X4 [Haemaphysalis longicornis]